MAEDLQKSCGLDVHKQFVIATILSRGTEEKIQKRFERDDDGILSLKRFVLSENCDVVACESTNDFWMPIYDSLCDHVPVIVGNARDIKGQTHKKTDKVDSEYIALLALNGMIKPSRVFPRELRQIRSHVRLRHKIVRKRTDFKNIISSILSSEQFNLKSKLTDIFGKTGQTILEGIIRGLPVDAIIQKFPACMIGRGDEFRELLQKEFSQEAILRLKECMEIISQLNGSIKNLEDQIFKWAHTNCKRKMDILMSVPGIGEIGAITLIAEIGDFNDFSDSDRLSSWLGIVPNVYQSANKHYNSCITKRGSKVARWILIQIAQVVASRTKDNILRDFFHRKKVTIGFNKAIVALAHKIARTIWHLVVNDEFYSDNLGYEKKNKKFSHPIGFKEIPVDECISIIFQANAILRQKDPDIL
jgi:transposase